MSNEPSQELSFAAWMRNQLILNPEITLEQLQAAYEGTDFPKKNKPKQMQVIYQARTSIKQRWGVELTELPRNTDGSLNMSGMIRLFLDKKGVEANEAAAREFFATDGLELKPGTFSNAKSTYMKKKNEPVTLDPNQSSGPRSRHVASRGKPPGRRNKKRGRRSAADEDIFKLLLETKKYVQMVGGVDKAMVLMGHLKDIQEIPY